MAVRRLTESYWVSILHPTHAQYHENVEFIQRTQIAIHGLPESQQETNCRETLLATTETTRIFAVELALLVFVTTSRGTDVGLQNEVMRPSCSDAPGSGRSPLAQWFPLLR